MAQTDNLHSQFFLQKKNTCLKDNKTKTKKQVNKCGGWRMFFLHQEKNMFSFLFLSA